MFSELEENLLKRIGKKGKIKVRTVLYTEDEKVVESLMDNGKIKKTKKVHKKNPAYFTLTEKGQKEYNEKFKK